MDERSPKPLLLVIAGLLSAITSFYAPHEGLSVSMLGVGLVTASFCAIWWLTDPGERVD